MPLQRRDSFEEGARKRCLPCAADTVGGGRGFPGEVPEQFDFCVFCFDCESASPIRLIWSGCNTWLGAKISVAGTKD